MRSLSDALSDARHSIRLFREVPGFTLAALAALALGIGANAAIYGLMAYSVQQRTQEIAIRLALGAEVRHVRGMVVAHAMRLALAGLVVGVAAAFALTRVIASFLFGVQTLDPASFLAVPALLATVALLAAWIPARRASRVDPITALRYE